jgi:hypothetical protein
MNNPKENPMNPTITLDAKTINERTGMMWTPSPSEPMLRAECGPLFLFLSERGLMVGLNSPVEILVFINDGDVESSIVWLADPARIMARVRELLAAMTAAVGAA